MKTATTTHFNPNTQQLFCHGDWNLSHLAKLKTLLDKITWPTSGEIIINGGAIENMDSAGAWLLCIWQDKLTRQGTTLQFQHFTEQHQTLLRIVAEKRKEKIDLAGITPIPLSWVARVGRFALQQLSEFRDYLAFVGHLTIEALRIVSHPVHLRWRALVQVIYTSGFQALPIVALLSFMIGVVLTYQMGVQLRNYGANIYIVDLLGLSVLREFAPLLTAIMVAGRTGSAFTAQLGMMKVNQEIDALDTMGVTPAELLLLPRIIGLAIALPLLTIWSDIFGIFGGMVMANTMLNITWYDFLHRFPTVIPLKSLLIGVGKAPVFALIIASIACFQGMCVKRNANSVGQNTTRSVVLGIFFIIVADAIFSIIFSKLHL